MRLTEYLSEAVANRRTGKYRRDTSLIEKISEFSGYGDITEAVSRRSVGKYMDPKVIDSITKSTDIDGVIKVLSGFASYYGGFDEFNASQIDTFKGMVGLYERSAIGLVYSTIKSGRERYLLIYYGRDRFLQVTFSNGGNAGIVAVQLLKLTGSTPMLTDMYDGRILDAGVAVMKDIIKDSIK